MAKDFITISKRKVQRLLELYTLYGYTQEEAAQIALKRQNTKGLSYAVVGRRVLHYLGLNMNYRRDYLHDGLTPEIIRRILSNRVLAFPLLIPIHKTIQPAFNFDEEMLAILNGGKRRAWLGIAQNIIAFLILVSYTWLFFRESGNTSFNDWEMITMITTIPFIIMPMVYQGDGDEFKLSDAIFMFAFLLFMIFYSIMQLSA